MKREKGKVRIDLSELTAEILNSVNDFIAITDLEGKIAYLNHQAEATGRYSSKEVSGHQIADYWRDRGLWKAKVSKVLQTRSPEEYEAEFLDRSGGRCALHVAIVPLRNAQGEITAIGVIGRDTTEIRRLEAELNEKAEDLKACIGELDAFVSTISHDLRTPLISVQGFANLLVRKYRDRLDEKGIQYLDRLKREADRMDQLLHDAVRSPRGGRSTE